MPFLRHALCRGGITSALQMCKDRYGALTPFQCELTQCTRRVNEGPQAAGEPASMPPAPWPLQQDRASHALER
jgi:hypothetical protein